MNKYEYIFKNAPISIWEEDWSELKTILDSKRSEIEPHNIMDFFDKNPDFVELLISHIKIVRVNPKTVDMHEANSAEDLTSNDIIQTFSEESLQTFKEEMASLYRGDSEFETKAKVQTLKNNPLYVLMKIKFPKTIEEYRRVVIVMEDITKETMALKSNEENFKKYQLLLESTQAIYIEIDGQGNIIECNYPFLSFIGEENITEKRNLNINFKNLIDEEQFNHFEKEWKKILNGERVKGFELQIKFNNNKKWVEMHSSAIVNGENKIFLLLTDIQDRKHKEFMRLIQKEKKKDKLKNEILVWRQNFGIINTNS